MIKKGFTLTELLAVIVLMGVIILFAVPNVASIFSDNKNSLNKIQKNQLESAVELYINDYCIEPISNSYECAFETEVDNNGLIKVKDTTSNDEGLSLSLLTSTGYFTEAEISNKCSGNIKITNGKIDLSGITCNLIN